MQTMLDLPRSTTVYVPIVRGGSRAVVRIYFADATNRNCCIDSRVLSRNAAINLARAVLQMGGRAECLAWHSRLNMARPPSYEVHRVRRLDDVPAPIVEIMGERPATGQKPVPEQQGLF